jgi:hypothetical protein
MVGDIGFAKAFCSTRRASDRAPKAAALAIVLVAKAASAESLNQGSRATIPAAPNFAMGSRKSIRCDGGASAAPIIASFNVKSEDKPIAPPKAKHRQTNYETIRSSSRKPLSSK